MLLLIAALLLTLSVVARYARSEIIDTKQKLIDAGFSVASRIPTVSISGP